MTFLIFTTKMLWYFKSQSQIALGSSDHGKWKGQNMWCILEKRKIVGHATRMWDRIGYWPSCFSRTTSFRICRLYVTTRLSRQKLIFVLYWCYTLAYFWMTVVPSLGIFWNTHGRDNRQYYIHNKLVPWTV